MSNINKKIVMIYPKMPVTFWTLDFSLPFANKKAFMSPLGLITVAAMIPKNYTIEFFDLNVTKLDENKIKEADLVFLSAMIIQKESFNEIVNICHKHETPVVAGGPYPTTSHDKIENVDYFVLNEGEVTLPQFLADYEKGSPKKIYWDETKADITKSPTPRFDLLNIDKYVTMTLQSSRGCPFNCEFCDVIEMFGRIPRYKTPDQFIKEMEVLYNLNYRDVIFIVDDNFIGNLKKAKELLHVIINWQKQKDYPFVLSTNTTINLAQDEELLDLMVEAGFKIVFIGIETPSEEILTNINKKQNLNEKILTSIEKIQKRGLEIMGGFVVGFDNEPKNIFDLQINLIEQSSIVAATVSLLMVLPKTQLYYRLQKEGRLLKEALGDNTTHTEINYIPTMPKEELIEGYKKIILEIYNPKNYFKRSLDFIKKIPVEKVIEGKLKARKVLGKEKLYKIKIVIKSLIKQSFSSYGKHYLYFLLKVLKYNSIFLPHAIMFAMRGHHFFKTTDLVINKKEKKIKPKD